MVRPTGRNLEGIVADIDLVAMAPDPYPRRVTLWHPVPAANELGDPERPCRSVFGDRWEGVSIPLRGHLLGESWLSCIRQRGATDRGPPSIRARHAR